MRYTSLSGLSAVLALLLPLHSPAQQDIGTIVVTATKSETAVENVSTTVTVITAEEIRIHGYKSVDDVLRSAVSFDISQNGGPGGISAPQMRGLTGKFMVVMLDGLRMNDPSDANGGPGTLFSHLTVEDIERIEVIRGPQSPLYGSNAAAGVINIITRSGGEPGKAELSFEGGSLNSLRTDFGYSVGKRGFRLRAVQGITSTDGVIALERYRNYTTSVKAGYEKKRAFEWESLVRYTRMRQDFSEFNENYDSEYGMPFWAVQVPDPHQRNDFEYTVSANKFRHWIRDGWQHELNVGVSVRDRKTADPDDGILGTMPAPYDNFTLDWSTFYSKGEAVPIHDTPWGAINYTYRGRNLDLDYRHTLVLAGEHVSDVFTAGLEYLDQDYDQTGTAGALAGNLYTAGAYFHNQALFFEDALSVNAGARLDSHKRTESSFTGMIGAAWDFRGPGLILRASLGSAFRAPSVYELYAPLNGNLDLKPETSVGYEAGVEKYTQGKRFRLMCAWWSNRIDRAIVWMANDPNDFWAGGMYRNYDRGESRGVEASAELKISAAWTLGLNYTYTDSRKSDSGERTWNRNVLLPFNKGNLSATYFFRGSSFSLDGYWVDGSRLRWNGIEKMDGYVKLDLAARVPLGRHYTGTLRVLNILDEDYFEGLGYLEPGRGFYGGIELRY